MVPIRSILTMLLVSDVCCCDMHDSRKSSLGQRSSFGQSSPLLTVSGIESWLYVVLVGDIRARWFVHSRNFAKYKSIMEVNSYSGERCMRCPKDGTSMNTVVSDWVFSNGQHAFVTLLSLTIASFSLVLLPFTLRVCHRTMMEVLALNFLEYFTESRLLRIHENFAFPKTLSSRRSSETPFMEVTFEKRSAIVSRSYNYIRTYTASLYIPTLSSMTFLTASQIRDRQSQWLTPSMSTLTRRILSTRLSTTTTSPPRSLSRRT